MYPSMLAYAERRVGSKEEAQDAVSEAMTRTVAGMDRLADTGATPESWLFGVLRHVVHRPPAQLLPASGPAGPPRRHPGRTTRGGGGRRRARRRARRLRQLPDRDRELLELRVVAGLSSEEVAAILDMRPGAVRTAQARALDKLRSILGWSRRWCRDPHV